MDEEHVDKKRKAADTKNIQDIIQRNMDSQKELWEVILFLLNKN